MGSAPSRGGRVLERAGSPEEQGESLGGTRVRARQFWRNYKGGTGMATPRHL